MHLASTSWCMNLLLLYATCMQHACISRILHIPSTSINIYQHSINVYQHLSSYSSIPIHTPIRVCWCMHLTHVYMTQLCDRCRHMNCIHLYCTWYACATRMAYMCTHQLYTSIPQLCHVYTTSHVSNLWILNYIRKCSLVHIWIYEYRNTHVCIRIYMYMMLCHNSWCCVTDRYIHVLTGVAWYTYICMGVWWYTSCIHLYICMYLCMNTRIHTCVSM